MLILCVSSFSTKTVSLFFSSFPLFAAQPRKKARSIANGGEAIKKRQTDMAGSANTGVRTGGAELTDRNHYTVPLRSLLFPHWDRASTSPTNT